MGRTSVMGTILLDLVWKGGAWWRVRDAVTTESAGDRCEGVGETRKVEQGGEEEIRKIDEILDVLNLVSSETRESRIWLWVLGKVRSRVVFLPACALAYLVSLEVQIQGPAPGLKST